MAIAAAPRERCVSRGRSQKDTKIATTLLVNTIVWREGLYGTQAG